MNLPAAAQTQVLAAVNLRLVPTAPLRSPNEPHSLFRQALDDLRRHITDPNKAGSFVEIPPAHAGAANFVHHTMPLPPVFHQVNHFAHALFSIVSPVVSQTQTNKGQVQNVGQAVHVREQVVHH